MSCSAVISSSSLFANRSCRSSFRARSFPFSFWISSLSMAASDFACPSSRFASCSAWRSSSLSLDNSESPCEGNRTVGEAGEPSTPSSPSKMRLSASSSSPALSVSKSWTILYASWRISCSSPNMAGSISIMRLTKTSLSSHAVTATRMSSTNPTILSRSSPLAMALI